MFIRMFLGDEGYAPTHREIADFFGWTSTNNVALHLNALVRKGYIERDSMKSRAIRVTQKGTEWGGATPIPNVLSIYAK